MNELKNSFLLLNKALFYNKKIRNLFIDTFSQFDYSFFTYDIFPDATDKSSWERSPFDISKGIAEKDLILFLPPINEFEIKISNSSYMEFLPDLKFALHFRKELKNVVVHFYKNGFISVEGNEKEKKFSNVLSPKDSFYSLLSLIYLLMNAGAYNKNNLKLLRDNFPDSCFFYKISEQITKNLVFIKNALRKNSKNITEDFFWKNGEVYYKSIINQEDYKELYSILDFPKKGVSSGYSFVINDNKKEFEFFFKELKDFKKNKVYYKIENKNLKKLIPEFIKIYQNKSEKYPYKVYLDYEPFKIDSKKVIILEYNIEKNKLEIESNDYFKDDGADKVKVIVESNILEDFFVKVEKTLFDFCKFSKTQKNDIFEPMKDSFVLLKKILINSCTAQLLVARI